MTSQTTDHLTHLESITKSYLELIRRIDSILADPVRTLIRIAERYVDESERKKGVTTSKETDATKVPIKAGFPVWMSEEVQPVPGDDLFSKCVCIATLQEVHRLQRRFAWLSRSDITSLRKLMEPAPYGGSTQEAIPLVTRLLKNLLPQGDQFRDYVSCVSTRTLGTLNPLTASNVFNVLLHDSETQAHGGLGFLAFFGMIWPLKRRFPDPLSFGAAIEPWEPKTYVTAKCILPVKALQDICTERAGLLHEIINSLRTLQKSSSAEDDNSYERWLFNVELDSLKSALHRLSSIVVAKSELRKRAEKIGQIAERLSPDSKKDVPAYYNTVLEEVGGAISDIGKTGSYIFAQAKKVVDQIGTEIVDRLKGPSQDGSYQLPTKDNLFFLTNDNDIGLKLAREYSEHPNLEIRKKYFEDLHNAAEQSHEFLTNALKILAEACNSCSTVNIDLDTIAAKAAELANANDRLANEMKDLVKHATVWCRTVADREIAHASAQNLTDFDPSELVSAIAVAVKWNQMTTTLQVADAVEKALAGMRSDGSWSPGQPFYSPNNAVGIWPVTSDVVLTLTIALDEHRDVEVADKALFRYVDWLELTRTELNFPTNSTSAAKSSQPAVGWASDRFRHRRKVHFPTTAFSVSALLKIRDLVEYRLWQLCEKRFTVIKSNPNAGLKKVAPVDLGAQHRFRLHRHLAWMAEAQKTNHDHAEYSLILHGPPGSSKTFIAKALSVEIWKTTRAWGSKDGPRLIRITPADFTRMGEDRLDSEARMIFDLVSGVRGVTIFFDEIDDLLRQRNTSTGPLAPKPTFMELVVPAMLNRLSDLREACPRQNICFLLATNFVESIEPALIRKGRIDRSYPVVYPDQDSRVAMTINFTDELRAILKDKLVFNDLESSAIVTKYCNEFASRLKGWPYLTIESAARRVIQDLKSEISENAGALSSKNLAFSRKAFLSRAQKDIEQVLREYGSSFSQPRYEERLVLPFCRELLDEYAHYVIAEFLDGETFTRWLTTPPTHSQHNGDLNQALRDRVATVVRKENRWPK